MENAPIAVAYMSAILALGFMMRGPYLHAELRKDM
jgi:hypothetical protein